jgi:hypothetical protein
MFRKIHSNRDPRDTLYSEIKKEFRPYVNKAGGGLKSIADRYPKFLFWMMVINITLSVVLSFTVFRHKDKKAAANTRPALLVNPVNSGFDEILRTGAELKSTILLKRKIDSLSAKKILSKTDSLALDSALDMLQNTHNHLKK